MRMRLILLQKSLITKFITLKVCKSDDFLDTWWDYIFKSDSYPFFSKAAKAVLYSFIGLQIGIFTSCMDIGAIMNVNYDLISKDHSSFQEHHCKNILHDPINTVLGYHMNTANCQHTKMLQGNSVKKYTWTSFSKSAVGFLLVTIIKSCNTEVL